jgi:hypothetical protein
MVSPVAKSQARCAFPVGILFFNRPDYAEQVLASLAAQTVPIDSHKLTIVCDGYAGSKDEHLGRPNRTAEVDQLARRYFPDATIVSHETNVGIARAFDILERIVFQEADTSWGVFFEEDFVVDPDYLDVLTRLIDLADPHPEIVQVNATGDLQCELSRGETSVYPSRHAWAFALRKAHWSERAGIVSDYLRVVEDVPYWLRDHRRVLMSLAQRGIHLAGTSQDAVKTAAVVALGRASIVTGVAHGEYIGRVGEHFVESTFETLGFVGGRKPRPRLTLPPGMSEAFAREMVRETAGYRAEQAFSLWMDDKDNLRRLEHIEHLYEDLHRQMNHIRSSTSWRMTAPVRWLGRLRPSRDGRGEVSSGEPGDGSS